MSNTGVISFFNLYRKVFAFICIDKTEFARVLAKKMETKKTRLVIERQHMSSHSRQ